jgi:hypothetical protein
MIIFAFMITNAVMPVLRPAVRRMSGADALEPD